MSVSKQILGSLVVVGLAVAAQAGNGPTQQSPGASFGSSQGSFDSAGQSSATSVAVLDQTSGSLVTFSGNSANWSSQAASDLGQSAHGASVWIVEKGSAASTSASTHVSNAGKWVVTKSGEVYQMSVNGSQVVLKSASGAIAWSGDKASAAGHLIKDSASNVWTFSKNSTVYVFTKSGAAIYKIGGSVEEVLVSTSTSVSNASGVLSNSISQASASSTVAPGKDNGAQYPEQHPVQK